MRFLTQNRYELYGFRFVLEDFFEPAIFHDQNVRLCYNKVIWYPYGRIMGTVGTVSRAYAAERPPSPQLRPFAWAAHAQQTAGYLRAWMHANRLSQQDRRKPTVMKPPFLLCYNLTEERARQIRLLAMRLKIRMQIVPREDFALKLAVVCGYEPKSDAEPSPDCETADSALFTDEMLVLGNFPNELLSQFLFGFRQAKMAPVALKAILTETNMQWDSVTLHEQISAEHIALAKGMPPTHEQA